MQEHKENKQITHYPAAQGLYWLNLAIPFIDFRSANFKLTISNSYNLAGVSFSPTLTVAEFQLT
jgi:hypothetical protein